MSLSPLVMLHPEDDVAVAMEQIPPGSTFDLLNLSLTCNSEIPAKHKVAVRNLAQGHRVRMYGVIVGVAACDIPAGTLLTTTNLVHDASPYQVRSVPYHWSAPEVSRWSDRTFMGYRRADGQTGTRNYWLVVPLVFCENRNIQKLEQALNFQLGYRKPDPFEARIQELISGTGNSALTSTNQPVFPQVDGVRFVTHDGGCGGTREDSLNLCRLIAGYYANPNVGGMTVLSLGCQHAQISLLEEVIQERYPHVQKPIQFFEQQKYGTTEKMLFQAVEAILEGLNAINKAKRTPRPLAELVLGLKCGGSDGFSGLTANPAMGYVSDCLAALGGASLLAEFPELLGTEQDFIDRCVRLADAQRFIQLMETYNAEATRVGSGFSMNPSPGNIKDGLLTDAMKSAGAARKGGRAPVSGVLAYGEYLNNRGLNLLCTPGNDVEATTAMAGSGANLIIFSTGLGTPTGNVVTPVIKTATNSELASRMPDIIDFDHGSMISEGKSVPESGAELLEKIIQVASGELTAAEKLDQQDFIPWKRGVSL